MGAQQGSVLISSGLSLGLGDSGCPSFFFLCLDQREPNWVSGFLAFGLFAFRELGTIRDVDKSPWEEKPDSLGKKITKGLGLVRAIQEGFPEEVTEKQAKGWRDKQTRDKVCGQVCGGWRWVCVSRSIFFLILKIKYS